MTSNNDIIRRIRYIFDLSDEKMVEIYNTTGYKTTREIMNSWLKKDEDPNAKEIGDFDLATFLNGFINEKRGKKEGEQPKPERILNNNIVLRKLRIALNYKEEDMLSILELGGRVISKHELSAFFRKPSQKQYRECKDQILRNFLTGLKHKFRR